MSGRVWLGLFFLLFGFGFLLDQGNVIDFGHIFTNWWPLILIIIGIIQLFNRTHSSAATGILFVAVGIFFLINQWYDLNLMAYFWPLIFIVIGLIIMFSRFKSERTANTESSLNLFLLLSGAEIKNQSPNFRGGNVSAMLGGAEIDLRDATIAEGALLDLTTVLGGVSIIVPDNVHVELSGTPILGGWENKTRVHAVNEEDVIVMKINCLTILGGAEIRN